MSIWQFGNSIVNVSPEHQITLGEGNTPLLRSRRIGPERGIENLFLKVESSNPTGSYKDRFAAAAVSHMLARGQRRCLATSSGNTGAALAAYCAAAHLPCQIAVVESTPIGKLKQMLAYGANLARVKGFGLDKTVTARVVECLQQQAAIAEGTLQISAYCYSPSGMNGVQTISYELARDLPRGIDHVFCPAGAGGLALAVALGFCLLVERASLTTSPAIHCVQPEGNNTIAGPLRDGCEQAQSTECTSAISGLQAPNVLDGNELVSACRANGGTGHLVSDEEIWQVQTRLAREEGLFCEPAGATALAGVLRAVEEGLLKACDVIVCLLTGSAFKDPPSVDRMIPDGVCPTIESDALPQWISN